MSMITQGSFDGSEEDHRETSRCLLDCLCKDEMKCCKSVPKMLSSFVDDRHQQQADDVHNRRSLDGVCTMNVTGDSTDRNDDDVSQAGLPSMEMLSY